MNRITYVSAGDIDLPVLFSQRTFINFERATKTPITKIQQEFSSDKMVQLALEAVKTGAKAADQNIEITKEKLLDLDDAYGVIEKILAVFGDDQKKQEPTSTED